MEHPVDLHKFRKHFGNSLIKAAELSLREKHFLEKYYLFSIKTL